MEYCKFCGTEIPANATICTGCHAEKKTGPSQQMINGCGTVTGVVACLVATFVFQAGVWALLCVLVISTLVGARAAFFIFRGRVVWRKPYQKIR